MNRNFVIIPCLLLILVGPAAASAAGDMPDGPWSFRNTSNSEIVVEVLAVTLRNGREVPINSVHNIKPMQFIWLEANNQKITGTTCTFVVRTPGRATSVTCYATGQGSHGDYLIDFHNEWLMSHLQSPLRDAQNFLPPVDPPSARHRNFLLHQINRVKSAMEGDKEAYLIAARGTAKFNEDYANLLEEKARLEAAKGNTSQAVVLRVAAEAPRALARKTREEVAAGETRNRMHQELLQAYERELNLIPAVPVPTKPSPPKRTVE